MYMSHPKKVDKGLEPAQGISGMLDPLHISFTGLLGRCFIADSDGIANSEDPDETAPLGEI